MLLLVQLFIHLHQLQFNNQLLLLVAHILGGSVRTKIGSGHSRPGENSWKVTSTKLLADWRVPRGFWQRWSDLVAQTSRSEDNCSTGAFLQSIVWPWLWHLKGLTIALTNYNKQDQTRKTPDKGNCWTVYSEFCIIVNPAIGLWYFWHTEWYPLKVIVLLS